jgi:hypothetical protein
VTRRFVLYRTQEEHSADCEKFPFKEIPRRIFLDTNIIDCLVKSPKHVFEMEEMPSETHATLRTDIESLMHVFHVGSHTHWDLVASELTLKELSATPDKSLREDLLEYGVSFVNTLDESNEERKYANDLARRLNDSAFLASLPDSSDRNLIAHAVALRCDAFCTRDLRSIHNKRQTLRALPLKILTPFEWWQHIRPWAGLWC